MVCVVGLISTKPARCCRQKSEPLIILPKTPVSCQSPRYLVGHIPMSLLLPRSYVWNKTSYLLLSDACYLSCHVDRTAVLAPLLNSSRFIPALRPSSRSTLSWARRSMSGMPDITRKASLDTVRYVADTRNMVFISMTFSFACTHSMTYKLAYVQQSCPFVSVGMNCNEEVTDSLHMTFKENAMFLLDLASTSDRRPSVDESYWKSGPWAVGEFKCLGNLEASASQLQSDAHDAILLQLQDCSPEVSTLRTAAELHVGALFKIRLNDFYVKRN